MKTYYLNRLHWIFHYTNKNFWYCVGKTLCLIVGVPIYAVCFVVEMALTFVNMLFSWIPAFNVVIGALCKILIILFGSTFYICILTDLGSYHDVLPNDDTADDEEMGNETGGAAGNDDVDSQQHYE